MLITIITVLTLKNHNKMFVNTTDSKTGFFHL